MGLSDWSEKNPVIFTMLVIAFAMTFAALFGTYVLDLGSTGNVPAESPNDSVGSKEVSVTGEVMEVGDDVERVVDAEAGVVCWKLSEPSGLGRHGGLSCLPLNETRLGGGSR